MALPIYKNELDLNLGEAIMASEKIAVVASITDKQVIVDPVKASKLYDKYTAEWLKKNIPADSALINSILVTTNWNRNDDIFAPEDTWAALRTPVWKPVNLDHKGRESTENQIIGVIQNASPVNDDYEYIYCEEDKVPEKFHILIGMIVWEKYFPEAVKEIKANIKDKKQYVSMECLISDFGYGLCEKDSDVINLMPRNEVTSKLTQHLKAYGGKGVVTIDNKEYKIGRWLRSYIFSGVAFVDRPANPDSIVFEDYISHSTASEHKFSSLSAEESEKYLPKDEKLQVLDDTGVLLGNSNKVAIWL